MSGGWGVWVEGQCGGWLLRNLNAGPFAWTGSYEEARAICKDCDGSTPKRFDGDHSKVMPFGVNPR